MNTASDAAVAGAPHQTRPGFGASEAPPAPAEGSAPQPAATGAPSVLVVDADAATLGLIEEWLLADGCRVVEERAGAAPAQGHFDLAIVDVPYPRQGGFDRVCRLAEEHPGTPIVVMSATFFAGAGCGCASTLGVAGVLPKPITRDTLVGAVRRLSRWS